MPRRSGKSITSSQLSLCNISDFHIAHLTASTRSIIRRHLSLFSFLPQKKAKVDSEYSDADDDIQEDADKDVKHDRVDVE